MSRRESGDLMRFLSRVTFKYVVPWVLCHLFMREIFLNLAGKERFVTPVVFVVCTGAFQRYWFVAPALGIGEAKAQAQTTCAVSKLVFHGCQVSGVFHHVSLVLDMERELKSLFSCSLCAKFRHFQYAL